MKTKNKTNKVKTEKKVYRKPTLKSHGKLSKVMGGMICFA